MVVLERYATLLAAPLRETPLLETSRAWSELELQARWFAGGFGREFTTIAGERVHIVQFGVWNREAGPDFAEAAVTIDDGPVRRGCIELDPDARDWERHGHAINPDYDSVILHVFTRTGPLECFTRTSENRLVPQVLLDLSVIADESLNPQPEAKPGRCVGPLRSLPEEKVREVLLAAAEHRLRRKSAWLARVADLHGEDEALYQGLAATLGYKNNKLPFTLVAQRLPLRVLRAARADAGALLFGVAGFLETPDLGTFDSSTRNYLRSLWECWWSLRSEFERLTLGRAHWRMSGQRPVNHPQRRLAALAQMVHQWPKVRKLRDGCDPAAIRGFFAGMRDEYWDFHYTVTSRPSAKRMALVGESRVTEMLVNVFFPIAASADARLPAGYKTLPAPLSNRRVKVAALRLFGDSDLKRTLPASAAMQQGLLQIYEDFCLRDNSDCAQCPFPQQLAKW
ncbi:MAG: DUF2851 family protein [Verrucomicrobiota bacterium]|nr:DUF2851 family protein [Verrucomicrobiota bacterium]